MAAPKYKNPLPVRAVERDSQIFARVSAKSAVTSVRVPGVKMNALAYVIAVLNPLLLNTRDVGVRLGPVYILADEIRRLNLPPDAFKHNSYYRGEQIGIYISNNLRNFMNHGKGERDEEGIILTIDFERMKLNPPNEADPLAFLLHPHYLSDADKILIDKYIQTLYNNRNVKSVHKVIS